MTTQQTGAGLRTTRRTLVKGAAWSVPVVAMGSTARADDVQCSPKSCPIVPSYDPGSFCKHPNDKAYHAVFCFNNTSNEEITVTFTQMTVAGTAGSTTITPATVTIPALQSRCYYVDGLDFDSMPEAVATLHFKYTYDGDTIEGSIATALDENQKVTPCGTQPREDQPKDKPPHDPTGP